MKKLSVSKRILLVCFIIIFSLTNFNIVFAVRPKDPSSIKKLEDTILKERQSEIIIKYKSGGSFRKINKSNLRRNVQSRSNIDSDIELLRLKNDVDTQKILRELNQNEFVEHAEVNGVSYLSGVENPVSNKKQQLDTEHQELEYYNKLLKEKNACKSQLNKVESEDFDIDLEAKLKSKLETREKDDSSSISSSDTIFESEPNDFIWMADDIQLDKYVYGTITDVYYDLDYYKLEIDQTGRLNILGAFEYPEYLDIVLLDANGDTIAWSFLSYTGDTQIFTENVRPGTYYIVVFQTCDYEYLCINEVYAFTTWMSDTSDVPVSSVSLDKNNLDMEKGSTETLNATVLPTNATNKSVNWTSSDTSVATVDSEGRVKGTGVGNAVITVETVDGGKTDTCDITVSDLPVFDDSLQINDPYYEEQWWLQSVNAPSAWEKIDSNRSVVVAVIDSGIEKSHDDLKNRIVSGGYNFITDSCDVYDINGHGTAVAGTIAAETNNNKGIVGVAGPLNVKVLPLQAGFYDGTLFNSDIVKSINYAIEKDVDVINLSCGSESYSYIENQAIQDAISKGIVVVAAAGNDGKELYQYPASYDNVISVGSISPTDTRSFFSNYNDKVDFVAPGEYIYTTDLYNSYDYFEGTSFSTPIVSGVVAMMKTIDPTLPPRDVTNRLAENAIDKGPLGKDIYYGYGLIDAYKTISSLKNSEVPVIAIEVKEHTPYMKGVGGNIFAPNKNVTRQEVATMIARANGLEDRTPDFKDAGNIDDWAKGSVGALQKLEIVKGDPKGNFNPKYKIDRASLAAMLVRAYEEFNGKINVGNISFKDVADDAWYAEVVKKAATVGIVKGDEKGNFNPKDKATRAETAAMVNRMLGLVNVEGVENLETNFSDIAEWPTWAKNDILVASTRFSYKVEDDGKVVVVVSVE